MNTPRLALFVQTIGYPSDAYFQSGISGDRDTLLKETELLMAGGRVRACVIIEGPMADRLVLTSTQVAILTDKEL